MNTYEISKQILAEVDDVLKRVDEAQIDALVQAIVGARQLFTHALGREGLVMRSFAMRLLHLGFKVAVVGDMTTPPSGPGDWFLVTCGPGHIKSTASLIEIAKNAGAKVALITAEPGRPLAAMSDLVVYLPAQTMAQGENAASVQLMGSVFEQAEWILLDAVVLKLKEATHQTPDQIRARHTNME